MQLGQVKGMQSSDIQLTAKAFEEQFLPSTFIFIFRLYLRVYSWESVTGRRPDVKFFFQGRTVCDHARDKKESRGERDILKQNKTK